MDYKWPFGQFDRSFFMNGRSKFWCFTLNNFTDLERDSIRGYVSSGTCTYVVHGVETAPATGTRHLQGYMEFSCRKRLTAVKKLAGLARAHIEMRRGTAAEASVYCKKDGLFEEEGQISEPQPGRRTDLESIKELIDNGCSEVEVAENYFGSWCGNFRAIREYAKLKHKKVCRDVEVYLIYGEPGTGKTRFCFEKYPDAWINSDEKLQWFDGYDGEETVILDDYRGEASDAFILKLLDRYPLNVPIKGGYTPWKAKRIFITSNMPASAMHVNVHAAFRRRIKKVMHMVVPLNFEDRESIDYFAACLFGGEN